MTDLFWDEHHGGLFTSGGDAESLITRPKDVVDGALPSANSTAAVALVRLSALVGEDEYRRRAEDIVRLLGRPLHDHPTAFCHLLAAVDLLAGPLTEVAVVGHRPDLVAAVQRRYLPQAVLAWGEPYPSPLFANRADGLAYVCREFVCRAPVDDVGGLRRELTEFERPQSTS